eukprot:SAG31_NODE_1548_length_7914_cov_5.353423_10_plen_82_part_00
MVRMTTPCLALLLPAATAALPGRPSNPVNLTLYHVGPANYPGLSDMNSGDAAGDAFFMLRAAGLPYLCRCFLIPMNPNESQ